MRYKVTNFLPPTEDGKEIRFEVVYDSFEKLVDKVVRDLNSFWKGMIPPNYTFNIKSVPDDTPLGLKYFIDGELIAKNKEDVMEAIEVAGSETLKYWRNLDGFAGLHNLNLGSVKKTYEEEDMGDET